MKEYEFCYWLQGAIEMFKPDSFSKEQTVLIKRHLDMVLYHEKNPKLPVIHWLNGLYEIGQPIELNVDQTRLIKEKLRDTFFHIIDPSYPSHQQNTLTNLHLGQVSNSNGAIAKC